MRVASKIDAQGFFGGDVLLEDAQKLPAGCVESRPPEGYHRPRWTGSAWTEGKAGAEVLAVAKDSKKRQLEQAFADETAASFGGGAAWAGVMVGALATDARDARITALKARVVKLRDKLAAVEGATTIAEVETITWT